MVLKMGRIRIKISFLFFAMLTMIFVIDEKKLAVVTLISVALHEMGHILALICFKVYPEEITFGIFGIRIRQNKGNLSYFSEAVVVLCGPVINIILFVLFLILNFILGNYVFLIISAVNLVIGVFNLLPIFPLDGGRVLFAVLSSFLSQKTVQKAMMAISIILVSAIILSGCFLALKTGANFSLLATGLYLAVLCIKSVKI